MRVLPRDAPRRPCEKATGFFRVSSLLRSLLCEPLSGEYPGRARSKQQPAVCPKAFMGRVCPRCSASAAVTFTQQQLSWFSVPMALFAFPQTRSPKATAEQSAALMSASTLNSRLGTSPGRIRHNCCQFLLLLRRHSWSPRDAPSEKEGGLLHTSHVKLHRLLLRLPWEFGNPRTVC